MPRRPKSGPPYTDIPKEIYVVVTNPWGMGANPRLRTQRDFDRIASWAQFVLQQAGLGGGRIATIECIYSMGTRDEIIIQFEAGTDIIPLLGEHRWANFAKGCSNPNDRLSTCVFIYNWKNNGDPSNHNWSENFPTRLALHTVPAKSPYPPPSWTSPPSTLTNFVLPIPHPPIHLPMPNYGNNPDQQSATLLPPCTVTPSPAPPEREDQPGGGEKPVAQDPVSESTNLFTPYEPHSQHPSHAKFLNRKQVRCDEASSSRASPPPPKFIKKLDPYELDEDALKILHSPDDAQEETKHVAPTAPQASPGYRPSTKLEAEINAFLHRRTATASASPVAAIKREYEEDVATSLASSSYRPSATLEAEVNACLQRPTATASSSPVVSIKREYREDVVTSSASQTGPPGSSSYRPSATLEAEINAFLQRPTATASSIPVAAIKREYEEDVSTFLGERKRIKIEEF